jgi:hypothetical protein
MPRGYSRLQDGRSVRYHIAPIHFEDCASYCRGAYFCSFAVDILTARGGKLMPGSLCFKISASSQLEATGYFADTYVDARMVNLHTQI